MPDQSNPRLVDVRLSQKQVHPAAQGDDLPDRVRVILLGHAFAEPFGIHRGRPHGVDEDGHHTLRGELHRLVQELSAVRGLGFAQPVNPQDGGEGPLALGRHDVGRHILSRKSIEGDVANGNALALLHALLDDPERNRRVVVEESALSREVISAGESAAGEKKCGCGEGGGGGGSNRVAHGRSVSLKGETLRLGRPVCQARNQGFGMAFSGVGPTICTTPFSRVSFSRSASSDGRK